MTTVNPNFTKTFSVVYKFEEVQPMVFRVFDIDNNTNSLEDDDFLGSCEINLSEIVCGINGCITRPLRGSSGKNHGEITIRSEQKSKTLDYMVHLEIQGRVGSFNFPQLSLLCRILQRKISLESLTLTLFSQNS